MLCRYFKYKLLAKNAITRENLPPFMTSWLDRTVPECMYIELQLCTFTTANLTGGGWYMDCPVTFTHPSEFALRKSFNDLSVIDLEVPEFLEMTDTQRKRAIARRTVVDKKKEGKEQEMVANKEKKEAERLAKLAEKEKEAEKEGKGTGRGKKKVGGGDQVPASSTVDQVSEIGSASRTSIKRKAVLQDLTEEMITQRTQVIVLGNDEEVNSEDIILNYSIIDVMADEDKEGKTHYMEVIDFLKKVCFWFKA